MLLTGLSLVFAILCIKTAVVKPECDPPSNSTHRFIEDEDQTVEGKYLPGDYISFACDDGYSPTSLTDVSCNEGGEWDTLPHCMMTACRTPVLENGHVVYDVGQEPVNQSWSNGELMSLQCNLGYNMHPKSAANLQCIGSQMGEHSGWDGPPPTCKPVQCSPIFSSDIEDGYVLRSGNASMTEAFGIGDNVTAMCHDGYILEGSKTRTCLPEGIWSGALQICNARDSLCGALGSPIGGRKYGNKYNLNDIVTFRCDPERTMLGPSERKCLASGFWSGDQPECIGTYEYMDKEKLSNGFGGRMHGLVESSEKYYETIIQKYYADKMNNDSTLMVGDVLMMDYSPDARSFLSPSAAKGIDIYFMIDTSKSISKADLQYSIDIIKGITRQLKIGHLVAQQLVSIVAFNNTVWSKAAPRDLKTKEDVYDKLDIIYREATGGGTAPKNAFTAIKDLTKIGRQDVPRAIVLFTDGKANMGGDPKNVVQDMKTELSIEFYVVAIGDADMKTLLDIATDKQHLIKVEGRSEHEIARLLLNNEDDFAACGVAGNHGLNGEPLITFANNNAWPWMVGIARYTGSASHTIKEKSHNSDQHEHICGGSIIDPSWVLTAAHCINTEHTLILQFGSIKVNAGMQKMVTQASRAIVHENFVLQTFQNDIALIKLDQPLHFQRGIRSVCLPEQDHEELYTNGTLAMVTGWGWWNNTHKIRSESLKQMTVNVYSEELCRDKMPDKMHYITEFTICSGGIRDHNNELMDACVKDSGGPHISKHMTMKPNIWVQTGIVSFGDEGTKCRLKAGGYVKVSKYIDWIKDTIKNN